MKKIRNELLCAGFILMTLLLINGENGPAFAQDPAAGKAPAVKDGNNKSDKSLEAISARVKEVIVADDYTYVQVDTGKKKIWVATPEFKGNPGDTVMVPPGIPMENYYSKTLDRNFETLYFVNAIWGPGEKTGMEMPAGMPPGHPAMGGQGKMPKGHPAISGQGKMPKTHPTMGGISGDAGIPPGSVEKAQGGNTVSEIIAQSKTFASKSILLRAKVVKFNANIMGKNWLHVQDGSGEKGANDLIVTTADTVTVGDLVLIRGRVSVEKDFGFGLSYPVIVEDAEITIESKK